MSKTKLHHGQHIWYRQPGGPLVKATVQREIPHKRGGRRFDVLRDKGRYRLIPEAWIIAGEIERCKAEEARCMTDATTDAWALLGARDWARERELLEAGR